MARDRLPPASNHSDDSDPEEEEEEEEEVEDEVVNRKAATEANSDSDEEEEDEAEAEEEDEAEAEDEAEEEEESEKTASPVRGLDYGSDADSEKEIPTPTGSDFVVKENLEGKKKRSAESEPVEKSEVKKSKKEKKKKGEKENGVVVAAEENVAAEDKAKRSSGQRIWGPEDEVMILKGMVEYKEKTGVDFNSNLDAFYQYIKGQLNAVVDKSQLLNKIRKLKEKYRDNAAKEANGETPVFLKIHEAEVYEHSKKVWGGKSDARSKSKSKKEKDVATDVAPVLEVENKSKSKKEKDVATDVGSFLEVDNVLALPVPELEVSKKEVNGGSAKAASRVRKAVKKPKVVQKMEFVDADVEMQDSVFPMPAMVNSLVFEKGLELVEKSKVDALNEKWTKYEMDAAELYLRKLDLIQEQTKLVLDALKSNP